MREELTKVRTPTGEEQVISQLSAGEAGLAQVKQPVFTPQELAIYADEFEGNGGVCQGLVALLLHSRIDQRIVLRLFYEIAAYGGIAAFVEAL